MKILILYLIAINIISFGGMAWDKRAAVKHRWRTPEKTLFLLALIGGSVGSILAMILLHHKNRKPQFMIGFPVIFVLQIVILCKLLG